MIATTKKTIDDKIIEVAKRLGIDYYRGDENDVLKRYIIASGKINLNKMKQPPNLIIFCHLFYSPLSE